MLMELFDQRIILDREQSAIRIQCFCENLQCVSGIASSAEIDTDHKPTSKWSIVTMILPQQRSMDNCPA